jgi:hypothetical protein
MLSHLPSFTVDIGKTCRGVEWLEHLITQDFRPPAKSMRKPAKEQPIWPIKSLPMDLKTGAATQAPRTAGAKNPRTYYLVF